MTLGIRLVGPAEAHAGVALGGCLGAGGRGRIAVSFGPHVAMLGNGRRISETARGGVAVCLAVSTVTVVPRVVLGRPSLQGVHIGRCTVACLVAVHRFGDPVATAAAFRGLGPCRLAVAGRARPRLLRLVILFRPRQFLGDQRFAVGLRDLVVVGMDLAEGEEAVAIAAILDEGGLQGWFDPRHLGEIDISLELFLVL